jgi:hypothetical protein
MKKNFADLLGDKLEEIRGDIPAKYYSRLNKKIRKLNEEAEKNFDGDKYSLKWAKKAEEIEVEMAFYHYIFNNRKFLWYIENFVYNGASKYMPPKDILKELVVYSLVSAGRKYELFDEVFYNHKRRTFAPVFERRLLDKYFVKGLYDKLSTYINDVILFRFESETVDKEKISKEIERFKDKFSIEKYAGNR